MTGELERNFAKVLANGPRLRYDYETWIIARADGWVIVGGLGSFGLGTMWVPECESHRERPGYDEAPFDPDARDGFNDTLAMKLEKYS